MCFGLFTGVVGNVLPVLTTSTVVPSHVDKVNEVEKDGTTDETL